jgi:hypothetical protein
MLVHSKAVPIIPVQPVFRAEPHEPLVVLEDTDHGGLGKALLGGDAIKSEMLTR